MRPRSSRDTPRLRRKRRNSKVRPMSAEVEWEPLDTTDPWIRQSAIEPHERQDWQCGNDRFTNPQWWCKFEKGHEGPTCGPVPVVRKAVEVPQKTKELEKLEQAITEVVMDYMVQAWDAIFNHFTLGTSEFQSDPNMEALLKAYVAYFSSLPEISQ